MRGGYTPHAHLFFGYFLLWLSNYYLSMIIHIPTSDCPPTFYPKNEKPSKFSRALFVIQLYLRTSAFRFTRRTRSAVLDLARVGAARLFVFIVVFAIFDTDNANIFEHCIRVSGCLLNISPFFQIALTAPAYFHRLCFLV